MHCYYNALLCIFINLFVFIFSDRKHRGQLSRTYGQRHDESIKSTRKKLNVTNTMNKK